MSLISVFKKYNSLSTIGITEFQKWYMPVTFSYFLDRQMDTPLVQLTVAWETDSMEQESEDRKDLQFEATFVAIRKGISAYED